MKRKNALGYRKKLGATKAPKFDIPIKQVISLYNLTKEQLSNLGVLTRNKGIANATIQGETYYRSETIERMFGHQRVVL